MSGALEALVARAGAFQQRAKSGLIVIQRPGYLERRFSTEEAAVLYLEGFVDGYDACQDKIEEDGEPQ